MTGPQRLVVFDIDGTLVDSAALIFDGFAAAFAAVGRPMPERRVVFDHVGLSLELAMAALMPEAPAAEVAKAVAAYKGAYVSMRAAQAEAAVPLFAGARAAIEALGARPDVLIGAATGMARRGLDHALGVHGLDPLFATRQTADRHPSKPDQAMLLAALAETGVAPGQAVMVGDTTYDIEMAANAGVAALGVSWGHHPPEALRQAGARRVLARFDELIPALDEIWRRA